MARSQITRIILGVFTVTRCLCAGPIRIEQVVNSYSQIHRGLPNYGIAQGAIFSLFGTDLAELTAAQGVPLRTSLAGVTIKVTVGAVTTQAIPYSVSPGQIIAVLPSKTPVGRGTITVISAGQTGSAPTQVVRSAFGLQAVLEPGGGAVVRDDDDRGKLLSKTHAANPGEHLTLWGSGLGPAVGDEPQYQTQANLTNVPIGVSIGGVRAMITYHGRSVYPGLDQINVTVPAGVSGCSVSLVVTAGGVPGNFATLPVASNGRICSDPGMAPVTTGEYQKLLSLADVKLGIISLTGRADASQPGLSTVSGFATFQKYTAQQFASADLLQQASTGSCLAAFLPGGVPPLGGWYGAAPLKAGPRIDVTGPQGSMALAAPYGGNYWIQRADMPNPIIPPSGGTFTFSNGAGGPDVGAFTASLSEGSMPPLVWTNKSTLTAIQRARGQLFTWTGGTPGSYVRIFGYSSIHEVGHLPNGSDLVVYFTCSAPVSVGRFTVPATVLDSLPPSTLGHLGVVDGATRQFSAPGMDLGLLFFENGTEISVPFN